MLNDDIRNRIVRILIPYKPDKIILFGSYGYGEPDSGSDIDILVIKDIPEDEVRNFRLKIKRILWEEFYSQDIYFDVVVDSEMRVLNRIELGDLFYQEIYTKGKIIYA
ncbi:MAG: nucleotidyltransferase domain-containing protein [Cyclobacteriaceae bacterium]